MPAGERLWRTDDGDLVPDGHPDARLLAYGPEDELADGETVRSEKGATPKKAAEPTPKKQD